MDKKECNKIKNLKETYNEYLESINLIITIITFYEGLHIDLNLSENVSKILEYEDLLNLDKHIIRSNHTVINRISEICGYGEVFDIYGKEKDF